jgi:hypothetical protein
MCWTHMSSKDKLNDTHKTQEETKQLQHNRSTEEISY